jgi:hypothetical protein
LFPLRHCFFYYSLILMLCQFFGELRVWYNWTKILEVTI